MRALAIPLSRPIATTATYIGLLCLSLVAARDLPLGLAPDVDLPSLTVSLVWPSASPLEMEALVTARVEAEVHELAGVEEVRSTSGSARSTIDVSFERGTDMDLTEVFLRERLAALREELPRDLRPPEITRTVPRGMEGGDFLVLQASGPYTAEALRELIEDLLLPGLLSIDGVAGAEAYGGSAEEIRIDVDRDALARGLVTTAALDRTLGAIGQDETIGRITGEGATMAAVLERPAATPEVLRRSIVSGGSLRPVRLADVATVTSGLAEPTRRSRIDGQPSVQIVVAREPGSNVVRVARGVLARVDEMKPRLPRGVEIDTVYDQSERVRTELRVLVERSLLGIVAIFGVMVLFHRRWRSPLVVLVSALFAGLGTFLLFRVFRIGVNLVTLSGLALALGMAVDNAIVILDNVRRRWPRGNTAPSRRILRTLAATREVLAPLVASTLATAVVLVPFLYLSGDLREYYLPFAFALIASLTASIATAVTLTPLLARWAFGERRLLAAPRGAFARRLSRAACVSRAATSAFLDRMVGRPLVPILVAALLFAGSVYVFATQISRGSVFPSDPDTSLRVFVEFPPGGEITQVDELLQRFERIALGHEFYERKYIDQVVTHVRELSGAVIVRFHPGVARTSVPEILRDDMTLAAASVSGVSISVTGRGPGYSSGSTNVSPSYQLTLRGPSYPTLVRLAEDLGARLAKSPRVANVDLNLSGSFLPGATELVARPNRERMNDLGISMAELVGVLQPAIASELAAREVEGPEGTIDARVRTAGADALSPVGLEASLFRPAGRPPVAFGHIVDIEERPVQSAITRADQQYEKRIGYEYKGPRKAGDRFLESLVEHLALPAGYSLDETFGSYLSKEDQRGIYLALALAFVLVYLVSAALFESLLLPFVAILSVPLGLVGIAAVFWAMDEPFDRTAYIGLILLVGIAINNGLILVHRMGELYGRTRDAARAAKSAVRERARPIVMTTATSVAGALPLVWNVDPNAVAGWRALALASIGGLVTSTLFALTVTPALFVLFRSTGQVVSTMPTTLPRGEIS